MCRAAACHGPAATHNPRGAGSRGLVSSIRVLTPRARRLLPCPVQDQRGAERAAAAAG